MKTVSLVKQKKSFSETLREQVGSIPNRGDSVEEVRKIRKKLSEKCKNMNDEELLIFFNSS